MNNRIFNIQGVDNFRHMGGYKTADGGITRDDRLYRCGHLFDLSEAGGKKIEALNINQVVDFRSEAEKEVRPAQWPNSWQPTYYPTPIGGNAAAWIKELFERIASGKFPRQDLHDQLIIAFRTIPIDNKDGLKRLFDVLIDGKADTATVFHCTAGKDRTGIGGALILRALGVHDDDILGDFHVHSNWSDGSNSIEEIVQVAKNFGYRFVCITDHSQSLRVANGLSESRVDKKIKKIQELNKKNSDFKSYCGTECDIKADGTMDYRNSVLKKFDVVYGGIHTSFKMDRPTATKRIVKAMENNYVHAVAHPTCRMIGRREPFDLDMEEIMDVAKKTDTFLEINAFPDRLDLKDTHVKLAKERGVKVILGSDAHFIANLPFMRFGIATARRGWLEKKDILNTYSTHDIEKILGVT